MASSSRFLQQLSSLTQPDDLKPLDLSKRLIENTHQAHQNLQLQNHLMQHLIQLNTQLYQDQQQQIYATPTQISAKKRKRKESIQQLDQNNNNQEEFECSSVMQQATGIAPDSVNSQILKAHLCLKCGRSFARSDMLTRHSRLHSGSKPYKCKSCNQVFSRSDHLSTHERTHTGEKPYQCEKCPYSACRRDMITRHMRTHENATAINKTQTMTIRVKRTANKMTQPKQRTRSIGKRKSPASEPDQSTSDSIDLEALVQSASDATSSSSRTADELCSEPEPITSDTTTSNQINNCRPLDLSKYSTETASTDKCEPKNGLVVNYQISSTS